MFRQAERRCSVPNHVWIIECVIVGGIKCRGVVVNISVHNPHYVHCAYTSSRTVSITFSPCNHRQVYTCKPGALSLTTLCLKKVSTFKHSVTLTNINGFSFFSLLESTRNYLENPYDIHLTLGMLLHYLGKLKSRFSRYSAYVNENAN